MPNHKRRIPKAKPMNPKVRKKKKPKVELVSCCDHCGNDLGRTCARTSGSAVCAVGVGLAAGEYAGRHEVYCDEGCKHARRFVA